MSYDLAVWIGERPADDAAAAVEFERRAQVLESGTDAPPAPELVAFVDALLARWPDLGEPGDERSPWASGPLHGEIVGDLVHFPMTYGGVGPALPLIAEIVSEHGLVGFDPQVEAMVGVAPRKRKRWFSR